MVFPEPVIFVAVEPKTKADQEKLSVALAQLSEEDPTFHVRKDPESGQTILSGMGELHLEILTDRMQREYKVGCNIGRPQVAYRETVTAEVTKEFEFNRETGGKGNFARVKIGLAPRPIGSGFKFENRVAPEAIPAAFIPAVEAVGRPGGDPGGRQVRR
jgi:elongation factor G